MKRIAIVVTLVGSIAFEGFGGAPRFEGVSVVPRSPEALSTPSSDLTFTNIERVGANAVALNVWWFQEAISSTEIAPDFDGWWSSTRESISHAIDTAHDEGLQVLLKPIVDVKAGDWRAMINPNDVDQWFSNYRNFMNEFAELAEQKEVAALAVGTELNNMEKYSDQWRKVLSDARARFGGLLTYAANWAPADGVGGGYESIDWWDSVDFIGIDAYFPLTESPDPQESQLQASWREIATRISDWRSTNGLDLPVVFTEVGYGSFSGAASRPWDEGFGQPVNLPQQAAAYNSMFETMWDKDWWDGAFLWNWETNPNLGGPGDTTLTPQNKDAERVVAQYYGGEVPIRYHPEVLSSWEAGLEGWNDSFGSADGDFDDLLALSTKGATQGSNSLSITTSGAGDHKAAHVFWSYWNGSDEFTTLRNALKSPDDFVVELDVTYESESLPETFGFMQLYLAAFTCASDECQGDDATWIQSDPFAEVIEAKDRDRTHHVRLPFSTFSGLAPDSMWYEFHLLHSNDWEESGTYFVDNLRLRSTVVGDLNNDGQLTPTDIDALSSAIRHSDWIEQYDVDGDGMLTLLDHNEWISVTHASVGDTDLDGCVMFSDFLALADSFGEIAGWMGGDFNGDGSVEFGDFLLMADNFGKCSSAASLSVPEPRLHGVFVGIVAICAGIRRRARQNVSGRQKHLQPSLD